MKNCLVSAPLVLLMFCLPVAGSACEISGHSDLEIEKAELSSLSQQHNQMEVYDFRTGKCVSITSGQEYSELEISAFIPNDETTLGIYQNLRIAGENQITALKHTLEFNLGNS